MGYTENQPFAVISDAFPADYVLLPKLPSVFYQSIDGEDRKAIKKRCWLPVAAFEHPVSEWLCQAKSTAELAESYSTDKKTFGSLSKTHPQPHNTINRQSNTTGDGGFAPYSIEQEWFVPSLRWTIYVLLDTDRLSAQDFQKCLTDIGDFGFGKDASIGLGKFEIVDFQEKPLPAQPDTNACLTLAPCAPQGLNFDRQKSFYQLFTRFGRHGDIAVHQEGKPFKNPILLAQTAAVLGAKPNVLGFIGQGIGGNGELSKTLPATVHQGYAPFIAINLKAKEC
ncbi:CRISPR-associated protein Csm7 [Methylicorpusculum oleiharenae]|nr:CRISPR-associated protein Csm7 [Methylicorpusculum oleiharenae]MCD2452428.1 CRISPR-associated protein Csm7 [Methylicorpusculum oleiharenae]